MYFLRDCLCFQKTRLYQNGARRPHDQGRGNGCYFDDVPAYSGRRAKRQRRAAFEWQDPSAEQNDDFLKHGSYRLGVGGVLGYTSMNECCKSVYMITVYIQDMYPSSYGRLPSALRLHPSAPLARHLLWRPYSPAPTPSQRSTRTYRYSCAMVCASSPWTTLMLR